MVERRALDAEYSQFVGEQTGKLLELVARGQHFADQADRARVDGRGAATPVLAADGIAAVDLATVLLSPTPDPTIEEPPRWTPLKAVLRAE